MLAMSLAGLPARRRGCDRAGHAAARYLHPRPVRPAAGGGHLLRRAADRLLPQKLKTSFEPILSPVITKNLKDRNMEAIAKQVRQVGFWIIAVQLGIALVLGMPGEAVMGCGGRIMSRAPRRSPSCWRPKWLPPQRWWPVSGSGADLPWG
jgi:hypothetical protein